MRLFLAITLLLITTGAFAQGNTDGDSAVLHYLVRPPKEITKHPPVIFLLHGYGANEKNMFSFADRIPDEYLVFSVRAPNEQGKNGYAWYQYHIKGGKPVIDAEQAESSRTAILQFIDQMQEQYHFDKNSIILCGFSQGAIMSYSVGLTNPNKIKGIAIMSGRILDEVKPIIGPFENTPSLQVFISHGTDDRRVNIHYARDAVEYLKTLGITPKYEEYDAAHTLNSDMINDMIKWLGKL